MMSNIDDPLVAPPPAEVPLRDAPLVRVIAQLRFPQVLSVEQASFVAPFQEAIRSEYPVLRPEPIQEIAGGSTGGGPMKPSVAWRFSDTSGNWRVSLTTGFLALETAKYHSRTDFLQRLHLVTEVLVKHIKPVQLDRLGLRYIDRITGSAVDDIAKLVRAEVRGIHGSSAATHATMALSETVFELPEAQARVVARWGCVPPNGSIDPLAIEAVEEKSWVLDLDIFSSAPRRFTVDAVIATAQSYAERIYTLFRWAVTDDFLRRYGGTP